MTPYLQYLYFGITLYVIIPMSMWALFRRSHAVRTWVVIYTLLMLYVQFWSSQEGSVQHHLREFWLVLAFAFYQWIIARGLLLVINRKSVPRLIWVAIFFALAPLLWAKFGSILSAPAPATHPRTSDVHSVWFGFLGVSYVCFRCIDVLLCIHDKTLRSLPLVQYMSFLLFAPTLSSGPIDRYLRFEKDWQRARSRSEFLADLDQAIAWVFQGFLYKFLLAQWINNYWMLKVQGVHSATELISYMYAYTLYLFFDFAGYSAFAVGFSYVLGIHSPKNFNLPFLSRNIREFWTRWHISLSEWFRDHVYTRFVMTATMRSWFSSRYVTSYLGFLLSMGLMGVWHGSELHYVLYGLYHASLLVGHDLFVRWNKKRHWLKGRFGLAISVFLTFHFVCFGLLLFSGKLL